MIRKVDSVGRVVIPSDMLKALQLSAEDEVKLDQFENTIVLTKAKTECIACQSSEYPLFTLGKIQVCSECVNKLITLKNI